MPLFALGALRGVAPALHAQEPEQVSGEVTCTECVITLDTVATIGGFDGPGLNVISMFSHVAVDRQGRVLVIGEAEMSVFDSTGRYLRTIGRRGEGPGEYGSISYLGVGSRYIHVIDYGQGRTMLDHDFQVVRTDRFAGHVLSAVVVNNDVVVFVSDVLHMLHVLRPSGRMTSHRRDGGVHSAAVVPLATAWTAMAGRNDTVWAVASVTNRLVRWDLAPEPKVGRVFDRRVPEFDRGGDAFAPAGVGSAWLDDRGLWLVWHTSDPDRTEPLPSIDLGPGEVDIDALRDSWAGSRGSRHRQDDRALSSGQCPRRFCRGFRLLGRLSGD